MRSFWAWLRWIPVTIFLVTALAAEGSDGLNVEKLVRFVSPEFRQIEKRIAEITTELESLPSPDKEVWGSRYGHRSADLPSEDQADWIQADFGEPRRIDTVVLMPAAVGYREEITNGYGFPKRFRIQLADNPDMEGAVTVVEINDADFENPGRYPAVFRIPPTEGRYLRFTSLKHTRSENTFFWAMEEIMALEGNSNVAQGAYDTMSSHTDLFPLWATLRAFNGQSTLGMPVDVAIQSPSIGYLAAGLPLDVAKNLPKEDQWKWCVVDLGGIYPIEQIRLCPLESEERQVFGGRGFPRGFRIELALDENFEQIVWRTRNSGLPLGFPSGWAMIRQVPSIEARYVRITATTMWARDNNYAFGLAELQIYGENQNLALGKPVFVKDNSDLPPDSGWAPEYLVDGYSSRYRLIEWPEYLDLLERRSLLERELAELIQIKAAKLLSGQRIIKILSSTLVLLILVVIIWFFARQRYAQRQAVKSLREQIARDLHDDIGSNLGGIVLLSEVGSEMSTDEESRHDFKTIYEAAEQASSSMRDIVWMVQPKQVSLKEMIPRMREVADMLLSKTDLEFTVQPLTYKDRNLSLFFRRHVFLAFKEALNNVRKHANAERVEILVAIEPNRLRFQVRDNGLGFDTEGEILSGYGLGNLKRRASRLEGTFDIKSKPGEGTTVSFEAPFFG